MNSETDAVRDRYAKRKLHISHLRYSLLNAANWQMLQERQRAMLQLFAAVGLTNLSELRLAEVGAGSGGNLLELLRCGFSPNNLMGLELLADRLDAARVCLPSAVRLIGGDATVAPIEPASLDIAFQSVVFSSLLDDEFQQHLAQTMWRWLKPGGAVLWYDFTYNNPSNADVRGVPLTRVRALFPGGSIRSQRITLAPPIARRVTAVHPSLYTVFNMLPLLRTHLLCWIQKQ
jgi:SAM-dependent methyltransferase